MPLLLWTVAKAPLVKRQHVARPSSNALQIKVATSSGFPQQQAAIALGNMQQRVATTTGNKEQQAKTVKATRCLPYCY